MRLALIKGQSYTYMTRTMESLLTVLSGLAPFALVFGLIGVLVAVVLGVRFDRRQQKKIWKVKNEECLGANEVFPNLPNFRQCGGGGLVTADGRKVREGRLFRSSRTDFLTAAEKTHFRELGIKSIIDLRHIDEYRKANGAKLLDNIYPVCVMKKGKVKVFRSKSSADSAPFGQRYLINMMTLDFIFNILRKVNILIRYSSLLMLIVDKAFDVHLFMRFYNWKILNTRTMHDQYVDLLEFGKSAVADILQIIIDKSPALVHCAHGKDRTGVVVAMILGCLGVSDEDIAQDYAMSYAGLGPIRQRLHQETCGRYGFKEAFTGADAETMRLVLKEIRKRYGSVAGYLEAAGFGANEQETLRNILLE